MAIDDNPITPKSALDKLERGLAKRMQGAPNLAAYAGLNDFLDAGKCDIFSKDVVRLYEHLEQFFAGVRTTYAAWESEAIPGLMKMLRGLPMSADAKAERIKQAKIKKRREILEIAPLANDRAEILKKLTAKAEQAKIARGFWLSPEAVLQRTYGMSDRAARARETLANANLITIKLRVAEAVASNDPHLACALMHAIEALPEKDRSTLKDVEGISKASVAEHFVGTLCKQTAANLDGVVLLSERAVAMRREAETGEVDTVAKLNRGARAIQIAAGRPVENDDEPADDPQSQE